MEPRDLSSLNRTDFKIFLNSFDTVLCDCDGVVWKWKTPMPRVKETLTKLREHGKQINFVTNNTTVTSETLVKDLNNCGFDVKIDEVASPNQAIIDYLKEIKFDKEIFIIGTSFLKKEFSDAGFAIADSGPDVVEENVTVLGKYIQDDLNVGAVICDVDANLNFVKLHKVLVYLKRPEVLFLVGGNDKTLPVGLPILLIGPGYFQNPLQEISGRSPLRFGKPAERFNKFVVKKFGIQDPSRTLFIGDNLEQDVGFATNHGYQSLLVLTGATSLKQAKKCTDFVPKYYINALGDLHGLIG